MTFRQKPLFWAVSIGHFTIDIFNGMSAVLMAYMSAHIMPITNSQIGLAISAYQLAGSISQPFFGWLGDRTGGRWIGAGGVAWTVSFLMLAMFLAQQTGQFWLMLIPFVIASFGSGAFHPVGAMHAADSDRERAASNTAMFFLFGQLGLGLGPVLVGFLLDQTSAHLERLGSAFGPSLTGFLGHGSVSPVIALGLIAIPTVAFMAFALPNARIYRGEAKKLSSATATSQEKLIFPIKAFIFLAVLITLRSLANPGVVAFIPRLFQLKGWDASQYGLITSLYWIGSGFTGVLFGMLADRYESRHIITVSLLLSAPALFLLPSLEGVLALTMAVTAGAMSGGSHSLLVVQAQGLLPGRKGFASGAILGFIFAAGAFGTLVIGWLSDGFGLAVAFQVVAVVTVIAAFMGLALPEVKRTAVQPAPEAASPEIVTT
jgi:FSR family fosmidomycin resistance protein-like MFS transporter